MNRDFYADRPNLKWVTDISYIHTKQGVLYLSVIRDYFPVTNPGTYSLRPVINVYGDLQNDYEARADFDVIHSLAFPRYTANYGSSSTY